MTPKAIWLTGLSGSGKSTIAMQIYEALKRQNHPVYILDGDVLRTGLNKNLGFSEADRTENIRRTAEVARLMVDAGTTVIAALISPYDQDRQTARTLFLPNQFFEIYINTPVEVCMQRDPKGLYARALKGEIKNFTGIDAPYEIPEKADLILDTQKHSAGDLAQKVLDAICPI